jgi:hypothetical protein
MAPPSDARHAAVELGALFGPGVVICSQADEPGAPPPVSCDDRCPICQANAGALAFVTPPPPTHFAPIPLVVEALAFPKTARAPPRGPVRTALARAPPSLV